MKKKILIILLILVFTAAVCLTCSIYRSTTELTVVNYSVNTDFSEQIRIVQLTDLHGYEFGENQSDLVELVMAQKPDLILMTGDMMDKSDEGAEDVCNLIGQLTTIAPVYYGYGNHEYEWMNRHGESLTPALTQAGAIVLDVEYTDVMVNDQMLRIGGYHGYYRQPGMYDISQEQWKKEMTFAEEFEDTDRFKILLCHIPTAWLDWEYIDKFPVDLVLAGHYHGGQVRLPLVGGLYAPYVGLFPQYTEGIFGGEQATCILSTGLGASSGIPRVNNLPQIVVINLEAE